MNYHLMFSENEIDIIVINYVRSAIKTGLFKKETPTEVKKAIIQTLHNNLCTHFKLPVTTIEYLEILQSRMGCYNRTLNLIALNKPSLVTYLHEFYHMKSNLLQQSNTEELAKGWSHSIFYLATPKLFINAIDKGLLLWQKKITK